MIFVIHQSIDVAEIYGKGFAREGFATMAFVTADFEEWLTSAGPAEVAAIEAFFVGCYQNYERITARIRKCSQRPVMVIADNLDLDLVVKLLQLGADDIVSHKTQVRILVAKLGAVNRRLHDAGKPAQIENLRVYYDGRDPDYNSEVIDLPRRERRILEYLVMNQHRRVTRSQIFSAVYGLFNEEFDENVIESHISKLRKRLKQVLKCDPIDSKRYLGYQFVLPQAATPDYKAAA